MLAQPVARAAFGILACRGPMGRPDLRAVGIEAHVLVSVEYHTSMVWTLCRAGRRLGLE